MAQRKSISFSASSPESGPLWNYQTEFLADSKQAQIKGWDWVLRGLFVICSVVERRWQSSRWLANITSLFFWRGRRLDRIAWSTAYHPYHKCHLCVYKCVNVCVSGVIQTHVPFLLLCYCRLLTQNQLYLFSLADWVERGVTETDLGSVRNHHLHLHYKRDISQCDTRKTFCNNSQTNMTRINTERLKKAGIITVCARGMMLDNTCYFL